MSRVTTSRLWHELLVTSEFRYPLILWFFRLESLETSESDPSVGPWIVRSLQVLSSSGNQKDGSQPLPLVIGRLVWDSSEACYCIRSIPTSLLYLWPTVKLESTCSATPDFSIPLVLKPSPWIRKPLPSNQSVVALLGCTLLSELHTGNHETHHV